MKKLSQNHYRIQVVFHILLWIGASIFIYRLTRTTASPEDSLKVLLTRIGVFLIVFYSHSQFIAPRLLFKKKYLQYGFGLFVLFVLANGLRVIFEQVFLLDILTQTPFYSTTFQILEAFISTVIVTIVSLFYCLGRQQLLKDQNSQRLISQQREAEIQLLRAQLNPHFLFNMLNNIYSLSITQSPKAPELILKLSDLLRYVTYQSNKGRVMLATEVNYIQVFIDIFQLKSSGPIPVDFSVNGSLEDVYTEPLLMIPLVENAFKHSDLEASGAFLKIELNVTDLGYTFTVSNSKTLFKDRKDDQGGVGLENIRKRIALQIDKPYDLQFDDRTDSFHVTLKCKFNE